MNSMKSNSPTQKGRGRKFLLLLPLFLLPFVTLLFYAMGDRRPEGRRCG